MSPDPIQLELMRNLFEAAAEEMGYTLQRVAFSANIKERRDFSCAIFWADGQLLAQAAHIPVHLGSMPACVEAVLQRLGPLQAGDVAIVNDPFAGGTHLPDITIISPIFLKAEGRMQKAVYATPDSSFCPPPSSFLIGYAANRAHHADVGGATPGSMTLSRHIDEEGVRIEPSYLYRAGQVQNDLLDRFLNAVRTPEERRGDLHAQLAANHVGAAGLLRMIDRHGIQTVQQYGQALLDYSQAFMRRAIQSIPPGTYEFEDVMDDDGVGGAAIPIRARITIDGHTATVDLRDSADQVAGCVNCPEAVTRSAVYYCFACLLDQQVPLNGGAFRDIRILTRPGSILGAEYPAAVVAGNTETSQRVVDVVFGALAQALPGRIPAASCGTMSSVAMGGPGWTYYETVGGGSGASAVSPGAHAVQCHMTNTLNTPAEALEMQYPLRVLRFERATGSGGAGRHAGGDGIVRELQALAPCEGTILSDRRISRPYGLAGGQPGKPGQNQAVCNGSTQRLAGKTHFHLQPGDRLLIGTPGGGGWG